MTGAVPEVAPSGAVAGRGPGASIAIILAMLTVFGPISLDLYLPVLPQIAADIGSSPSGSQLTMTACLIGLAFGQVVAGPISDRFGRRRILIVGVITFVVSSVLCSLAVSITQLVMLRLVQGLAGAVGLVIANAGGRDVYEGAQLTRHYGRIVVLSGLAAIVAPAVGGQLARVMDWRGFFLVLAGIGSVILVAVIVAYRETLPQERRTSGGLRRTVENLSVLARDRAFVVATTASSLTSAAYFGYLAAAAFVLGDIYELGPGEFSLVFAANASGFALFGFLAGRASERWTERVVFALGIGIVGIGAVVFTLAALSPQPLWVIVTGFFVIAAGAATVAPPSTSIALRGYAGFAGTASSMLGVARFTAGAIAAPLVGLSGALSLVPLALVLAVTTGLAALVVCALPRRLSASDR